jgi:hypothetical protein
MQNIMNRRDAISRVALILGGTIVGAEVFLAGCKPKPEAFSLFEDYDVYLLDEIAETILPATDTPGAKEAKVGEFMTRIVRDCYEEMNQVIFLGGMKKIDEESFLKYGATFLKITPEQRLELLSGIDEEQKLYTEEKAPEAPPHYFRLMKELTLWGFFTSEAGATKVLRYLEVPGKFDGCAPYEKGEKAWAT